MAEATPSGDDELPTLDQLRKAFINSRKDENKAKKTIDGYKYSIQRFQKFLDAKGLEYTDIDQRTDLAVPITATVDDAEDHEPSLLDDRDLIDYWLIWMRDEAGYAHSTIRSGYGAFLPFLKFLKKQGYIEYIGTEDRSISDFINLGETIQGSRNKDLKKKAISKEEHEQLKEHVREPTHRNILILDLLWETGLRREELAELALEDWHPEERRIHVPAVKWRRGVTPERRDVWVSPDMRTRLNIWKDVKRKAYTGWKEHEYIFLSDHGPNEGGITPKRVGSIVQAAAERAGIQEVIGQMQDGRDKYRISTHSYRHAFAFNALAGDDRKGGMDIYALCELMGHESVETTQQYLDSEDPYLKSQMDQFRPR